MSEWSLNFLIESNLENLNFQKKSCSDRYQNDVPSWKEILHKIHSDPFEKLEIKTNGCDFNIKMLLKIPLKKWYQDGKRKNMRKSLELENDWGAFKVTELSTWILIENCDSGTFERILKNCTKKNFFKNVNQIGYYILMFLRYFNFPNISEKCDISNAINYCKA